MKKDEFEEKMKEASKAMTRKKAPSRPETQFQKGAMWAWNFLMSARDAIYYEQIIREEVCDRYGVDQPDRWMESLICDLADQMAERDGETEEIRATGRTWKKVDKNLNTYEEQNPHINLKKEVVRSIGILREHLGLSVKANPSRMKESPKSKGTEQDKLTQLLTDLSK